MAKKILRKRYLIPAAIFAIFLSFYILYLKPNPVLRVDANKIIARGKNTSALNIIAPEEIDGVGKTFTVQIELDSMGTFVNAIQSYLEFDPRVLQISDVDTSQSFCKFYPENNFNNEKGIVKLSCGSPYPGFRGKNIVQKIDFTTKAIRTTELKLQKDSMVLANDGKGTNLLKELPTVSIKVKAAL